MGQVYLEFHWHSIGAAPALEVVHLGWQSTCFGSDSVWQFMVVDCTFSGCSDGGVAASFDNSVESVVGGLHVSEKPGICGEGARKSLSV